MGDGPPKRPVPRGAAVEANNKIAEAAATENGGKQTGKKEEKAYNRNHTIRVIGTTTNSRGELLVQFNVNLTDNDRFPNRSKEDYRGELTYKQMQNGTTAIERLSNTLRPHPLVLIPDPYEDYSMLLLEAFDQWDSDVGAGNATARESETFKKQGWYNEEGVWFLVTGPGKVWDITRGGKLSEEEVELLSKNLEFSGTEEKYKDDKKLGLELLSKLISTFHSVGDQKYRSFFPTAIFFYYKSLLFIPRTKEGQQNKVLIFLSGPETGTAKTWTCNVLQKMSLDDESIAQCYFSRSSSLVGIFKQSHNLPAVFLDEIENDTDLLQKLKAIIDARWTNSPHTNNTGNLFATSAVVFCGNFSKEELMGFKMKKVSILQEKNLSKTTLLYSGNKTISGADGPRKRTFEIAKELKNHLPYLLHLTMKALDFQMTDEESESFDHIHKEDRYKLDFVEYCKWVNLVKSEMVAEGVEIPEVFKSEVVDVSALSYQLLKGKTGLKDLIKFSIRNDCTDLLLPTKNRNGEFGFKVEDRDFQHAPDEITKFLSNSKSSALMNKDGKKCRMRFLPLIGLDKKYLSLVQNSQLSVADLLSSAFSQNVEFDTHMGDCFVSLVNRGVKRKRAKVKPKEKEPTENISLDLEETTETINEIILGGSDSDSDSDSNSDSDSSGSISDALPDPQDGLPELKINKETAKEGLSEPNKETHKEGLSEPKITKEAHKEGLSELKITKEAHKEGLSELKINKDSPKEGSSDPKINRDTPKKGLSEPKINKKTRKEVGSKKSGDGVKRLLKKAECSGTNENKERRADQAGGSKAQKLGDQMEVDNENDKTPNPFTCIKIGCPKSGFTFSTKYRFDKHLESQLHFGRRKDALACRGKTDWACRGKTDNAIDSDADSDTV